MYYISTLLVLEHLVRPVPVLQFFSINGPGPNFHILTTTAVYKQLGRPTEATFGTLFWPLYILNCGFTAVEPKLR